MMQDDVYQGIFIPAGATIVDNTWYVIRFCEPFGNRLRIMIRATTRDESVYPDPHVFNPGRFLKDGQINPDVKDPEQFVFGWGRRCFLVHREPDSRTLE